MRLLAAPVYRLQPHLCMQRHPVRFRVAYAPARRRIHIAIRLALLAGLGAIGFSSVYWLLYLCLPAIAAAYAYLWLLTDELRLRPPSPDAALEIEPRPTASASAAMLRLLTSIPAVLLLIVLSVVAGVLWIIGAIAILIAQRLPPAIADLIALTLRYQFRLFAYHLSLVDAYPSLEPDEVPHAPGGAAREPHVTAG